MGAILARCQTVGLICMIAVAVMSCAADPTKACVADGQIYYCEEGKECGGLQQLCVDPGGCGNGLTEGTEECDDGNIQPGDKCSPTCRVERCGNGFTDPGEICDDGNQSNGDGCANDCASTNVCGNNRTDVAVGEECDDGGAAPGDGCGPTCRFERCGNHLPDPGEQCDDGNAVAGDGCSRTCFFERCRNGRPDPGEFCDDGNEVDTDRCNNECSSDNRCGNNITDENVGEVCDEGGVTTENCTADCRSKRKCGDGILDPDAGEECDDGADNNRNDHDCRADCIINRCGDSYDNTEGPLHREDCDDGPEPTTTNPRVAIPTETAGCNLNCTSTRCGDALVNRAAGEQCDNPGNNENDHDCTALCRLNVCGDHLANTVGPSHREACDDGNAVNGDDCTNQCTLPACGDGILEGEEQCDDHNEVSDDGCSAVCRFELCGDGIKNGPEQCDRADPVLAPGVCNVDCTLSSCGDHKVNLEAGEQCDEGAPNNQDTRDCTALCQINVCGDGHENLIGPLHKEQCDDHNRVDSDDCTNACQLPFCGDGTRENLEQCDDGNHANDDGCSSSCRFEVCGDGIKNGVEDCDRADPEVDPATCNLDCTASRCGDRKLNREAGEQCDVGDADNRDDKDCTAGCKVNVCGDGLPNLQGPAHVEECDDHNAVDSDTCTNQCTLARCGDGILEGLEQCDDHNEVSDDGCSATCKFELCGDGVINGDEACDFFADRPGCNLDCTLSSCGDGQLNTFAVPAEQCDDHNELDGDGCSGACQLEHCGNGVVDAHEDCDGAAGLQPCSPSCHHEVCGNGIVDVDPGAVPPLSEQCDLGDDHNSDTGVCLTTCQLASCGDLHVQDGVEQCDAGEANADTAACTSACRTNVCGDGLRNEAEGAEACDAGADNTEDAICPYGVSCAARCSKGCELLTMITPQCGDGTINGPERCDDHNADACGSCSSSCALVTAQRAVGYLIPVGGVQLHAGEQFTLDDGINPPVVFVFQEVPVPLTAVPTIRSVEYTVADQLATVRQAIIDAINLAHTSGLLLIQAPPDEGIAIRLIHDRPTALGNRSIIETVVDPTFFALPMVGGIGGDCLEGQGCQTADDCASHTCTAHVCEAP